MDKRYACVFDLDGTLADTLPSLAFSVSAMLKELGLPPIDNETCARFIGNGARKLVERSLDFAGGDPAAQLDDAIKRYLRIFAEGCTYHVTPYPGIPELLQDLKSRGVLLAVFSNKPHAQTVKVIDTVFGEGVFDAVEGQKAEVPRKPDPAGLLQILAALSVEKENVLYVGDSDVDIKTGRNAGVKTASVTWGFRTREQLMEAGAKLFVDRPEEILSI